MDKPYSFTFHIQVHDGVRLWMDGKYQSSREEAAIISSIPPAAMTR